MRKKSFVKETLLDEVDFKKVPIGLWHELKELYAFYISDRDKKEINKKNIFWRFFIIQWRILKALLAKLTPIRRGLTFVALIFIFFRIQVNRLHIEWQSVGILLIIVVLLLELKDKLLARNELAAGQKVQKELLPTTQPTLNGWDIWMSTLPALEVGGDFVDYQNFGDDLYLALGDVSGKGLGAALYMARLQATIRAINSPELELSNVIQRVNHIFKRDGAANRFASLLMVRLKPLDGELQLVNAGQLPPYWLKGDQVEEIGKGGPALGLMDPVSYSTEVLHMDDDDALIVVSDGIPDAKNAAGIFYGEENIVRLLKGAKGLTALQIGYRILDSVMHFTGETSLFDDMSVLVVKKMKSVSTNSNWLGR